MYHRPEAKRTAEGAIVHVPPRTYGDRVDAPLQYDGGNQGNHKQGFWWYTLVFGKAEYTALMNF